MITTQHTPAPWRVAETKGCGFRIQSDSGIICWEQKNGFDRRPKQESEANGRLIAAAPEMLIALEVVAKEARAKKQLGIAHIAEHVIAKAKGGAP